MIYKKNVEVIRDPAIKDERKWRVRYDGKLLERRFPSPSEANAYARQIGWFLQAGELSRIDRSGKYGPQKGPDGFSKFCKDRFGIEYRQARYHIQVYRTFSKLGKFENDVGPIGISKAAVVAQLGASLTKSKVSGWLNKAKKMDREALKKEVQKFMKKHLA